jgi:AmiR/NasT family two-component response regulator
VAHAFAGYAGLAMANDYLNDARTALSRRAGAAMDSGAVIDQANGIIMGDRRCSPEEAFAILTTLAQDTGCTVREAAQALVARTVETPGKYEAP